MSRTRGNASLSSVEAAYDTMISALAEAKQVQDILSEYHEETYIILEPGLSAAKASTERLGCANIKLISVQYRYLQDAIANQDVCLRKVGTKIHVADTSTKEVYRNDITKHE